MHVLSNQGVSFWGQLSLVPPTTRNGTRFPGPSRNPWAGQAIRLTPMQDMHQGSGLHWCQGQVILMPGHMCSITPRGSLPSSLHSCRLFQGQQGSPLPKAAVPEGGGGMGGAETAKPRITGLIVQLSG